MQEMWVLSLGLEDPLEKKMAIHSSILARERGEKRVGHKESDMTQWLNSNISFLQNFEVKNT